MQNDLTPSQRKQVLAAQPKVRAIVTRLCPTGGKDAIEDLTSVANIALLQALRQYDPARGTLIAYATPVIEREIRRAMRKFAQHDVTGRTEGVRILTFGLTGKTEGVRIRNGREHIDPVLSLTVLVSDIDDKIDVALRDDRTPEDACCEAERSALIRNALSTLTPREHLVVRKLYFSHRPSSQEDVARELGLSRQRVQQIEADALRKLREVLGPEMEEMLT